MDTEVTKAADDTHLPKVAKKEKQLCRKTSGTDWQMKGLETLIVDKCIVPYMRKNNFNSINTKNGLGSNS